MQNIETGSTVDIVDADTAKASLLPNLARGVKSTAAQVAGATMVADDDDDDSGSWPDGDACIRIPMSERPTPCK